MEDDDDRKIPEAGLSTGKGDEVGSGSRDHNTVGTAGNVDNDINVPFSPFACTYDYETAGEVDLLAELLEADDQIAAINQVYARSRQLVSSHIAKPFALRSWYSEYEEASQALLERQRSH